MKLPRVRAIKFVATAVAVLAIATVTGNAAAQQIPAPADVFGFKPGTDYKLADYDQLTEYYRLLADASDRVLLKEIGRSTQDRPMYLLFVSSSENLLHLDRWREISRRLARADALDEDEARRLAGEGRAIVWIDNGLHSSEVAPPQHAPLLAYHMATDESEESRRIRDDVVLLLMPNMNPDGHQVTVGWYREQLGTDYETTSPPWLYHEYVGHDINRDWFMITQQEPKVISRVLYEEWYPQIVFNHHQTAPFPARIFIPPFADPVNPHIQPLVVRGVNIVGEHMAKRFEEQNMPGVVSRMTFTMWWNGGMRTVPYFKNMVGILSEIGHASATPRHHTPESLPDYFGSGAHRISAREPSVYYANPWPGGWARLGDAVEYTLVSSLGALDIASRLREDWLFNAYRLGRASREAGEAGNPFAYIIAEEDQWDRTEAVRLINTLRRGGVEVKRATATFQAGGRSYPAGSYIIPAGQAFRPYVMDLLEKQEHPHHEQYPGGPPQPPYGGLAGWTLPIQMGVQVDRIDAAFNVAADPVSVAPPASGKVTGQPEYGYLLSPRDNAVATALNRLLDAGERVSILPAPGTIGGRRWDAGTYLIETENGTRERVAEIADELGLTFTGITSLPDAASYRLVRPRVGLYKSWVANMDEGWTRFLLHQHDFDVTTLSDQDIREGDLSGYHIIILPDQAANRILYGHAPGRMPEEYTGGVGSTGVAALKRYVEDGGRILAFDAATDFAIRHLELPVENPISGLRSTDLHVPGSLIRLTVDNEHPVGFGMQPEAAAFFQGSRAFRAADPDNAGAVQVIARYGTQDLLLSGWEIGADEYLAGRGAVVRVPKDEGDVVLIGFRPQFRAWPGGTFKLIFNSIMGAALVEQP